MYTTMYLKLECLECSLNARNVLPGGVQCHINIGVFFNFRFTENMIFQKLQKIKKMWYLQGAFLQKCCFSCSDATIEISQVFKFTSRLLNNTN